MSAGSTDLVSAPLRRHVQERRRSQAGEPGINVGDTERWFSLLAGGGLALYGIIKGRASGLGLTVVGGALVYRGLTGHCSGYEALGISSVRDTHTATSVRARHGERVDESITILRSGKELYAYWRDFSNLPRIMQHLQSVQPKHNGISHWVARGPLGLKVEWDAEIITERENELIGWRSLKDSEVDTAGSVHFTKAPGGRGTEVRVELKYDPPAGKVGIVIAKLLGQSPSQSIHDDLRRFKQIMETGTVATIEGQPRGACP